MDFRKFRRPLVAGLVIGAGFIAGISIPPPAPQAAASGITSLHDPLVITRTMCRSDKPRGLSLFVQNAIAAEAPSDSNSHARSPRFSGLGPLSYRITTASPDAQFFFDQGLKLFYAFNPGEAVASFRAASDADPSCAMCYWGEALTLGPNLNGPMDRANNPAALAAVKRAGELAATATATEQALIKAIAARYSSDPKAERDDLDLTYADAMAAAHAAHPDDPQIAAIYAEAAMNVGSEPWSRWWDKTGRHPTSYVADAIATIEDVLASHPEHPGAIHLYIHALDGSAFVDKVVPYAEQLARLMPNAGHMVHMPAHAFFNVGRYKDALATNVAAIEVDDAYLKGSAAATPVYRYGLYQHNVHFAIAAAEMAGDEAAALRLGQLLQQFQARHPAATWDIPAGSALLPVVRFQSPAEMLALPKPDRKRLYVVGIWHFARGSAYAYQKDTRRALTEAKAIDQLRKSRQLGDMDKSLLGVAAEVVRGRAAAAEGRWMDAADHFGKAVEFQDEVPYRDPPFWNFPVRQSQGVALYRAGKLAQAAETLRQALIESTNSGYALYALREVSTAQGDELAAGEYGRLFEQAWVGAEPPELDRL